MEEFKIRSYGRTELAQLYSPDITPSAAYQKLVRWIRLNPSLRARLAALGTSPRSRTFTPAQVRTIISTLGEP